jgi:hypothetical protein
MSKPRTRRSPLRISPLLAPASPLAALGAAAAAALLSSLAGGCIDSVEPEAPSSSSSTSSSKSALSGAQTALQPRALPAKPAAAAQSSYLHDDEIIVKLKEGTRVRLRAGALAFDPASLTAADRTRLARLGLAEAQVAADVAAVNAILGAGAPPIERHFDRPEATLEREQAAGEASAGRELADLNLYFAAPVSAAAQTALLDQLNALDSIELAYAPPRPEDAWADAPPATSSYAGSQDYVNAAPVGIDAAYARTVQGGAGLGVKVIDVEGGWNLAHEDAPTPFATSGVVGDRPHGTAVMGVIAAVENGYGMLGAASDVKFGVASVNNKPSGSQTVSYSVARAVNAAAASLAAGDVILIEQHARGPASGLACTCNCDQFEYIAMEYWSAEFDAMEAATALGINVVEAAGNGSMNLDSSIYGGRFDRAVRDSGAIIVGAGTSNGGRAPECWTNRGARVDLQGWGDSVATLGYGTLAKVNGADENQWYSSSFSGTSSASPIVVSAVADLQGARIAHGLGVAPPAAMRSLLVATGTPQTGTGHIGPLPNLRAALDQLGIKPKTNFVWTATPASRVGNATVIDHPATNGNPNAVLQVTHNWGTAPGVYDDHPLGVWYDGTRWEIFHQDWTAIPADAMYNVVVGDGFVHRATPANTTAHVTRIDNPYANGNPDAILIVTPSWNPGGGAVGVYNNHPIGVWYDGSRWAIYNEDLASIPANASFNVEVSPYGSFTHVAATPIGNTSRISGALAASANAHVLITHNYGSFHKYNTRNTGVYYTGSQWAVYTEDQSPMIQNVAFDVFVANASRATW